jgi:3-hexulose-6-phosphate synthase / 6-phospho-3-hexuloisomerase
LGNFQSSDVSDALDRIGVKGVLGGFLPVADGATVNGSAFPVFVRRTRDPSRSMQKGLLEAIRKAPRGSVLVIRSESEDYSCWGGVTSWYAKMNGIAGVVTDGAVRDLQEIRKVRLPVFSRKRSPASGYGRLEVASIGRPVKIDFLTIRPGDLVAADSDGVAVVPKSRIKAVRQKVREVLGAQVRLRKELKAP